jgi:hypothetical protein
MAKILVGHNENVKPGAFRRREEIAILDSRPALFLHGSDVVSCESVAHLRGHAFVEQDLHAAA